MAEKKVVELEVNTNLGSLKQQFKQAQQDVQTLADKFGATSKEAVEAAKKAALLKDKINDAKNLTAAFNPDAKFNALSGSLTGVAGGFSAVTGAMAIFGKQNEDVQKALLKVQAAMAIASGLQAVGQSIDAFKQLGAVIKSSTVFQAIYNLVQTGSIKGLAQSTTAKVADTQATVAQGAATVAATTATTGASVAMKNLRIALISTGIGLFVIALGAIVVYWDKVTEALGFASEEQKKYAKQQKLIAEQAKKQREEVAKESGEFATLISRLKSTNENSKEREELIKKINKQYGTTLKNIKDERDFQEQLNTELASYLEYQKAKYELQKNDEKIQKNLEKQDELNDKINKNKKELIRLTKEQEIADKEAGKASQQTVTGGGTAGGFGAATTYQESYEKLSKKASLAVKEQQQSIKDLEQQLQEAEERYDNYGKAAQTAAVKVDELTNSGTKYVEQAVSTKTELVNLESKIIDEEIKAISDANQRQQTQTIVEATRRIKEIEATKASEKQKAELIKQIEQNLLIDLDKLDKEYYKIEEEKKKQQSDKLKELTQTEHEKLKEAYNAEFKLAEGNVALQTALTDKYNKEKDALDKTILDKKIQDNLKLKELTLSEGDFKLLQLKTQYEAEQLLYKDNAEMLLALKNKYEKDVQDIETASSDKAKELRERNLKFAIESMTQILSITQDLATMSENKYKEINDKILANENLTDKQKQVAIERNNARAKKSFEANKKFQIASTLISTFAAARDAYKSQFIPPDGSSPIRGAIAAAIATAGGLVAIKKIKSTQFQGTAIPSGSGGDGGGSVPTMSAPQFNVVGQSGINQLASLNQQPIQAYVVSGQVTSQQALDRNRLENATLGG